MCFLCNATDDQPSFDQTSSPANDSPRVVATQSSAGVCQKRTCYSILNQTTIQSKSGPILFFMIDNQHIHELSAKFTQSPRYFGRRVSTCPTQGLVLFTSLGPPILLKLAGDWVAINRGTLLYTYVVPMELGKEKPLHEVYH